MRSTKSASRKKTPKPSKQPRKAARRPKELEDNPRLRYQRLSDDQFIGAPKKTSLAQLREAAIEDTRDQEPFDETPTTPATPGASNWVQLGPLAIPNGQTYGGARVVVTGRERLLYRIPPIRIPSTLPRPAGGSGRPLTAALGGPRPRTTPSPLRSERSRLRVPIRTRFTREPARATFTTTASVIRSVR